MGSVAPDPEKIYSFDDLLELEDLSGQKYELLDGRIVAMTGGTRAHNLIALGLFSEIDRQKADGWRLYVADVKLRIPAADGAQRDSGTYPDVMLACGKEVSELYEEAPVLLAEVLSDSTARQDKGSKRDRYLGIPSLQVYLVLSQTEMMMTVYQRERDGWQSDVYLRTEADIELRLRDGHRPLAVNLGRIYRNLAGRI